MSTFNEPLSIIRAQDNLGVVPLQDDAAKGATSLDVEQSAVVLGEPIPIVFCRRTDGIGGVLVSPQATEAGYSNNASTNELTVNLELVLSEGELPLLQIRDVFQRACRVGTWAQAYDARRQLESWQHDHDCFRHNAMELPRLLRHQWQLRQHHNAELHEHTR